MGSPSGKNAQRNSEQPCHDEERNRCARMIQDDTRGLVTINLRVFTEAGHTRFSARHSFNRTRRVKAPVRFDPMAVDLDSRSARDRAGLQMAREVLKEITLVGRLAQLVEHCDHTAGVTGSSPVAPTNLFNGLAASAAAAQRTVTAA